MADSARFRNQKPQAQKILLKVLVHVHVYIYICIHAYM